LGKGRHRASSDHTEDAIAADKLRGVPAIASYIGETERRTYYLLDRKLIPAGKEGSLWLASKAALTAHYNEITGRKG
jgi:hypothetical protein